MSLEHVTLQPSLPEEPLSAARACLEGPPARDVVEEMIADSRERGEDLCTALWVCVQCECV